MVWDSITSRRVACEWYGTQLPLDEWHVNGTGLNYLSTSGMNRTEVYSQVSEMWQLLEITDPDELDLIVTHIPTSRG